MCGAVLDKELWEMVWNFGLSPYDLCRMACVNKIWDTTFDPIHDPSPWAKAFFPTTPRFDTFEQDFVSQLSKNGSASNRRRQLCEKIQELQDKEKRRQLESIIFAVVNPPVIDEVTKKNWELVAKLEGLHGRRWFSDEYSERSTIGMPVAAGVDISPTIMKYFASLKAGEIDFMTIRLSKDYKYLVLSSVGEGGQTWKDFAQHLPPTQCRYGIFNYKYTQDGSPCSEIIFILWLPDLARVKDRMVVSSCKDTCKRYLSGIAIEMCVTDEMEMDEYHVTERLGRF